MRRFGALSVLFVAACTGGDATPPTLEVMTPERGTIADSPEVTVTGTVVDEEGDVSVAVNGVPAQVAADGTFSATIEVPAGVTAIETIATDGGGNTDRDVRAVMTGDLAPTDGFVADAVGAKVGAAAFNVIGGVATDMVKALDLGAMAQPMNPVVSKGGSCLGVDVDVTDANIGDFSLDLTPQPGSVVLGAAIRDLRIDLHANYHVACIGGNSDIIIYADTVTLDGGLGLDADAGALHATVGGVQVLIDGLYLDVGGLPDSVVNLFSDQIGDIVADMAAKMIEEKVPGMVEQMLTDMAGTSYSLPVLDRNLALGVTPTQIDMDYDGVFIALDTTMRVEGGEGGFYVSTPEPMVSMATDGLGIAVSDDALNQLFAGFWASGALDQAIPVTRDSPISLIIGADTTVMRVEMSLPPTVSMDPSGDLRLTVGDVMLRAQDESGADIMTVAMTMSTTLGAEATADQHVRLRLGEPSVFAQVVSQNERPVPMTDADIEGLVETIFPTVQTMANHAMESMPLPSVIGVSLDSPSLESSDGYVQLTTSVTRI